MFDNYEILPEHMQDGARRYVENGQPPGGFLSAVLENNFTEAVGHADHINQLALVAWARWVYNDTPSQCHGSREAVRDWCKQGGLNGRDAARKGAQ